MRLKRKVSLCADGQSNAAYIYDNGFIKQSQQAEISDGTDQEDPAEASSLLGDEDESQAVAIPSDVRAKRLLVMAQQEGNSAAALRLGDYSFYGYGREEANVAPALGSTGEAGLASDKHETDEDGLAIHHGIRCDASGMFPILGNRWHKTGEDFDLCEAEYQKLSEVEQQRFELVSVGWREDALVFDADGASAGGGGGALRAGHPVVLHLKALLPSTGVAMDPAGKDAMWLELIAAWQRCDALEGAQIRCLAAFPSPFA